MPISAAPGFFAPGQVIARGIATGAARRGRLGRSLLVHGPREAGATSFVDDLLALLLCEDADPERRPCNACRGCRDARARVHPDLVVGSPASWRASRVGGESIVAAARRWLMEASGAPIVAERRIVLIDEADGASEQAQNALLKALEEPNPRQMFVLTATDPARLLPTIRSRCQPLRLGPVPRQELTSWLMEHEQLPLDQARMVAVISRGMAGAARSYARQPESLAWRRRVQGELLSLLGSGRAARFAAARELVAEAASRAVGDEVGPVPAAADDETAARTAPATAQQRAGALMVLDAWIDLARDLVVVAAGRPPLAASRDVLEGLDAAGRRLTPSTAARAVRALERVREGVATNAAPRLAMSVAMLAWPALEGAS